MHPEIKNFSFQHTHTMQCRIVSNAIVVNLNCSWIFKLQKWENVHVNIDVHFTFQPTVWPHPHVYVFIRKQRLFCLFSHSVHTQTVIQRFWKSLFSPKTETFKNGFERGDFRKRCVVVWMGENRDFWKQRWFENACTCGRGLYIIVPHYIAYVPETEICDGSNYTTLSHSAIWIIIYHAICSNHHKLDNLFNITQL